MQSVDNTFTCQCNVDIVLILNLRSGITAGKTLTVEAALRGGFLFG
jgi:hypothetical protein